MNHDTSSGTPGLLQSASGERKEKELPDIHTERVNMTLLPDPNALSLRCEQKSSPTRLLAGVVYYTIQKVLAVVVPKHT